MRIRIKNVFRFMDGDRERCMSPGIYEVPKDLREDVARLAISFGAAVRVDISKVAPENKAITAPEDKETTEIEAKPAVRKYRRKP